jgi:MFS family permease
MQYELPHERRGEDTTSVPLQRLLLATVLLSLGGGLLTILIPIGGESAGFSVAMIGALGTSYYLGFIVGCLLLPALISRFGHIRSFAAIAAVAASGTLIHILDVTPWTWLVLRAVVGFCFAGLFMVVESWLNDQVVSETRGRVLGLYMVAGWFGMVGGNLLFALDAPTGFPLFALASIAICVSLVPIALTTGAVPMVPAAAGVHIVKLYRTAPVGVVGCLAAGLANGAFWTFAPLFAQARSGSGLGVSLFMSAAVIGSAFSQWPIGKVSDHIDRRWVIAGVSLVSAAVALLFVGFHEPLDSVLIGIGAVWGAAALTVYPLCSAHVNDRANPAHFVTVSSRLLMAFGLGAIAGPVIAGALISKVGITSLFAFTAAIHMVLAAFTVYRITALEPVPEEERVAFAPLPPIGHGTQPIFELQESAQVDRDL